MPRDSALVYDPQSRDTIAAIATARGEGGVAVIRLSGPDAFSVLDRVFKRAKPGAYAHAMLYTGVVTDGARVCDTGMAVCFIAPRSFTGENVAEIHGHGGREAPDAVLRLCLDNGAHLALPGEYSYRAYLNGKLDLAQAEAIADLIEAKTAQAARLSVETLLGGLSEHMEEAQERLLDMLVSIDASVDFPEEDIDLPLVYTLGEQMREIIAGLDARIAASAHLRRVREGARVCIAGSPNAGKSSLFNALLSEERAITSGEPGTTRDTLEERLSLCGADIVLTDTAGMREASGEAERQGVERGKRALLGADLALVVIDGSTPLTAGDRDVLALTEGMNRLVILNKRDLPPAFRPPAEYMRVSAATGEGMDALCRAIADACPPIEGAGASFQRERHVEAARRARASLSAALDALGHMPMDCVAVDIHDAFAALSLITGRGADEDIIDGIFSTFCLGK